MCVSSIPFSPQTGSEADTAVLLCMYLFAMHTCIHTYMEREICLIDGVGSLNSFLSFMEADVD